MVEEINDHLHCTRVIICFTVLATVIITANTCPFNNVTQQIIPTARKYLQISFVDKYFRARIRQNSHNKNVIGSTDPPVAYNYILKRGVM